MHTLNCFHKKIYYFLIFNILPLREEEEDRRRETLYICECINVYMVTNLVRRDSSMLKAERLRTIRQEMAVNLKDVVRTEKILDWIELNIGLSRLKAKEYIDLIIRTEGWVESDGKIAFTIDDL